MDGLSRGRYPACGLAGYLSRFTRRILTGFRSQPRRSRAFIFGRKLIILSFEAVPFLNHQDNDAVQCFHLKASQRSQRLLRDTSFSVMLAMFVLFDELRAWPYREVFGGIQRRIFRASELNYVHHVRSFERLNLASPVSGFLVLSIYIQPCCPGVQILSTPSVTKTKTVTMMSNPANHSDEEIYAGTMLIWPLSPARSLHSSDLISFWTEIKARSSG